MIDPSICLAFTIFYESRNEPIIGQIATANVVMNRVESPRYPNDICSVVKQKHQFEFYWDGKLERKPEYNKLEIKAWEQAKFIAEAFLAEGGNGSQFKDYSQGALHYAANYVKKGWMNCSNSITIGRHTFYLQVI